MSNTTLKVCIDGADMAFPASEDKIDAAETALERPLPAPLRAHLKKQNGGDLVAADDDWILHPVRDVSDRKRLARTANDIVNETKMARKDSGFPAGGIAIASNGTGDRLVLLPQSNAIFHWDHETRTVAEVTVEWDMA